MHSHVQRSYLFTKERIELKSGTCQHVRPLIHSEVIMDEGLFVCLFVFGATVPSGPEPPHSRVFIGHTQRRTTVGRTPLNE